MTRQVVVVRDDVTGDGSDGPEANDDATLDCIIDWALAPHDIPGEGAAGIQTAAVYAKGSVMIKEVSVRDQVSSAARAALGEDREGAVHGASDVRDVRAVDRA